MQPTRNKPRAADAWAFGRKAVIMSGKTEEYARLVLARKRCGLRRGLANPSSVEGGQYDSEHVGPWSKWQGNLDAEVMVVGQDWGDTRYFLREKGGEHPSNPTNGTLVKLLDSIGVAIGPPGGGHGPNVAFFTNAILCLKSDGLQGKVQGEWFAHCRRFLRAQIDIVRPRIVIGLGRLAFTSILRAFDIQPPPFRNAVADPHGTLLPTGSRVFAVYHCGARILNTHRSFSAQVQDWKRIGFVLAGCPECHSPKCAAILYGMPAHSSELEAAVKAGDMAIGGCILLEDNAEWRCIACGHEFRRTPS
jgi:uracil-DNA glycosylase family 4